MKHPNLASIEQPISKAQRLKERARSLVRPVAMSVGAVGVAGALIGSAMFESHHDHEKAYGPKAQAAMGKLLQPKMDDVAKLAVKLSAERPEFFASQRLASGNVALHGFRTKGDTATGSSQSSSIDIVGRPDSTGHLNPNGVQSIELSDVVQDGTESTSTYGVAIRRDAEGHWHAKAVSGELDKIGGMFFDTDDRGASSDFGENDLPVTIAQEVVSTPDSMPAPVDELSDIVRAQFESPR